MPLEAHDYLVSQGWGGKGTGLRQGAISRPIAIPMKKNLAGLGKDRDEAFPFWDHLYTAAAKSITIKYVSDDEGDGGEASTSKSAPLRKTATGILSTRRPIDGAPAHSGNTTPNEGDSDSQTPRLSLMAQAQREAAKRRLYANFFRGPVLGPEAIAEEEKRLADLVSKTFEKQHSAVQSMIVTEHIEIQTATDKMVIDLEVSNSSTGKRKVHGAEEASSEEEEDEASRKERKRKRKEEKQMKEKNMAKQRRRKEKRAKQETALESSDDSSHSPSKKSDSVDNIERRRKKEEKRRIKALRKQLNVVNIKPTDAEKADCNGTKTKASKQKHSKSPNADKEENENFDKKRKKRRRNSSDESS
ncbi:G patch domain-containing protein 4 [Psilocybe cubensis]|uniref:G patch domain-containing protein 4 n=2 Tax=Psilocybe cubensis TaxID=181762 RepID=A0ACB8GXX4_PSICU|nr:G patch domain-containing protein 4 [Psilocybe cubensis]KAH9480373.1 G patch domain-containing protein 4 [Psilocybe cubensis]